MRSLREPPGDLCDGIRGAYPRHLRILVGAWMLGADPELGERDALKLATKIYEDYGQGLLDKPGHLTDASIAREMLMICESETGNHDDDI